MKDERKATVQKTAGGGIGLFTIIGVVLLVLKLTGNTDLSWFWVIAPFWLPEAAAFAITIIVLLIIFIIETIRRK